MNFTLTFVVFVLRSPGKYFWKGDLETGCTLLIIFPFPMLFLKNTKMPYPLIPLMYLLFPPVGLSASTTCNMELWHQRLGHSNIKTISSILKSCNLPISNKPLSFCNACCFGKSHKLPFSSSTTEYSKPLELIHTDLWGPAPTHLNSGYLYYMNFVDFFSRFTWIYMMKKKYEALDIFVKLKLW